MILDKVKESKKEILKKHCYTELVYDRINKKLDTNYSKKKSEDLIEKVLRETDVKYYEKIGKNFYITNNQHKIRITINSNTYRIITVDKG